MKLYSLHPVYMVMSTAAPSIWIHVSEAEFLTAPTASRRLLYAIETDPADAMRDLPLGVPNDVGQQINWPVSAAFRKGQLWERCQWNGRHVAESDEFTKLRDETVPDAIAQLQRALASAPPAQQAEIVDSKCPNYWDDAYDGLKPGDIQTDCEPAPQEVVEHQSPAPQAAPIDDNSPSDLDFSPEGPGVDGFEQAAVVQQEPVGYAPISAIEEVPLEGYVAVYTHPAQQAKPQPVARVAEVHLSRYTIEWLNGPLPEGTLLYAPPTQGQITGG